MNESCQHKIAIASIPLQQTDFKNLYDGCTALSNGTIFPELNKPFFVTEAGPKDNQKSLLSDSEKMLFKVMECCFIVQDLNLYLDTHPGDMKANQIYTEHLKQLKQLKQEFADKHFPLTEGCIAEMNTASEQYAWSLGPAPWEGVYE